MSSNKIQWNVLNLFLLIFVAGLFEETRLSLSKAAETGLLILWLVLFYGALAFWLMGNRDGLKQLKHTTDALGRPIPDPEPDEETETPERALEDPIF